MCGTGNPGRIMAGCMCGLEFHCGIRRISIRPPLAKSALRWLRTCCLCKGGDEDEGLSLKSWWKRKSGAAKLVTALTTVLLLQIGLCFASPGEPAWFDRLFHIKPSPYGIRLGLVIIEAYLCIFTFVILLIAVLIWVTTSFAVDGLRVTPAEREDSHDQERDS